MNGLAASVEALIDAGANLESMDGNCNTPRVYAAERGHLETLEALVYHETHGREHLPRWSSRGSCGCEPGCCGAGRPPTRRARAAGRRS